ncbi:MAG: hypothetical protein N2037_02510 [Acidimicrobiales bacterium]|nr:hypothetical protein [Acidimicrobiales bacterium]
MLGLGPGLAALKQMPTGDRWLAARRTVLAIGCVAVGFSVVACTTSPRVLSRSTHIALVPVAGQAPRDLVPYAGLGTWVDVFDYAPSYTGGKPSIVPSDVGGMAEHGIQTLFLQAARWDDQSPGGLVNRELLRRFLIEAHDRGIRVVGWYLPNFGDLERDLARLRQVRDFEASGHRFDGIAIDIEYTEAVPDTDERNARLVELSRRLRSESPDTPIAAIVPPAVQLEVVNPQYWPQFPYRELADLYDVWMPMAYWSFRSAPYDDGYSYVYESVVRLRSNLDRPDALVAPIGGIADAIADEHIAQFVDALVDTGAIGGSLYDWNTTPPGRQHLLHLAFTEGRARSLPSPPDWPNAR